MTNNTQEKIKEFREKFEVERYDEKVGFYKLGKYVAKKNMEEWLIQALDQAYQQGKRDMGEEIRTMLYDDKNYTWIDIEGKELLRQIIIDVDRVLATLTKE